MNLLKIFNKIIEYSFYSLFLLVPLAFTSATSELFEMNKMWLTWSLTIVIAMSWFAKMILQRKFFLQRTPLDIPIGLFLLSQIISTVFSWDVHVSLWGYYSRFNGGLLSILSYVFLYYAFLSNFGSDEMKAGGERGGPRRVPAGNEVTEDIGRGQSETGPAFFMVKRLLSLSLISGLIVALWGLPSHFGYDPTCLLFRGTLDVSCWTADFMPRVRIFSTLGQPAWLAAYLAILIPITIALILTISQNSQNYRRPSIHLIYFAPLILLILFYVDLLYTRARSGILGVWLSLIFFFLAYFFIERNPSAKVKAGKTKFSILIGIFLIITFVIGTPINQLHGFTLEGVRSYFQKTQAHPPASPTPAPAQSFDSGRPAPSLGEGGTESGDIRVNVWKGAIDAWKNNPIFGTGVETFAFAYYKYKPVAHNLTSEWNFLYNKAHNEYLNYLATTGVFGLGSYLLMIGYFLFLSLKQFKIQNAKLKVAIQNSKLEKGKFSNLSSNFSLLTLNFALLASYISILVTNFFGFSVVITNIYLFMIPAFVFILGRTLDPEKKFIFPRTETKVSNYESRISGISLYQWTFIFFIILVSSFMLSNLFRFWQADIAYALGYNLDRAGEYQQAYPNLHKAVELRGDELVFKDELSINDAIIAAGLLAQKDEKTKDQAIAVASSLVQEAISTSNEIVTKSPNNAVFWKTRTRIFYTLSQIDSRYLPQALQAIEKAASLSPNDASISYNLGVLYGQNNSLEKAIEVLENTIKLKPNYQDAYYALGLIYHEAAIDKNGTVTNSALPSTVRNPALQKKAIEQMHYIIDHFPNNSGAKDVLKAWGKE